MSEPPPVLPPEPELPLPESKPESEPEPAPGSVVSTTESAGMVPLYFSREGAFPFHAAKVQQIKIPMAHNSS